jgi:non-ribosomal peptide synthetase component F
LQANAKTVEGRQHPDRDAQFRHINAQVTAFGEAGDPVISRMLAIAGGVPDGVRLRLTSGVALTRDLADEMLTGSATVWNGYGPTETTIYSTAAAVT